MNELEILIMGVQRKLLVMYDDLDLSDLSSLIIKRSFLC